MSQTARASHARRALIDKLHRSYCILWGEIQNQIEAGVEPAEAQWTERTLALRLVFRAVWAECWSAELGPTQRIVDELRRGEDLE